MYKRIKERPAILRKNMLVWTNADIMGSYTGRSAFHDRPEQDADDL